MDCNRPRILDIGRRRLGQQLFADIYEAQVTTLLALKSSAKRSFWPMRNLRDAQVCERVCIQSQPILKYGGNTLLLDGVAAPHHYATHLPC